MGEAEDGGKRDCQSELEALQISEPWEGVVLGYSVDSVNNYVYVYLWGDPKQTCLAIEITSRIVHFESDEYERGEWLSRFLTRIVPVVGASACTYGRAYPLSYEPLDVDGLLARVRDGSLFTLSFPAFFMISDRLISRPEMKLLVSAHNRERRFSCSITTTGYHVIAYMR